MCYVSPEPSELFCFVSSPLLSFSHSLSDAHFTLDCSLEKMSTAIFIGWLGVSSFLASRTSSFKDAVKNSSFLRDMEDFKYFCVLRNSSSIFLNANISVSALYKQKKPYKSYCMKKEIIVMLFYFTWSHLWTTLLFCEICSCNSQVTWDEIWMILIYIWNFKWVLYVKIEYMYRFRLDFLECLSWLRDLDL